jgi:hypothetical protein
MKTVNKWHFFINFKDMSSYKEAHNIKRILDKKIKNAKVSYSFEF